MTQRQTKREKGRISEEVVIRKKSYLSTQHLKAARFFAVSARDIEAKVRSGDVPHFIDSIREEYRSFAIGAVFAAVAFVEARINEFLEDLRSGEPAHLDAKVISTAVRFFDREIERRARLSILEKYDLVLELFECSPFDRGGKPYQYVKTLIQLRNALVHYRPEWVRAGVTSTPQEDQHQLERSLKGRFEESPLDPPGNPFYPDRCISGGCADWAAQHSTEFVEEFLEKLGVDSSTLPVSSESRPNPAV